VVRHPDLHAALRADAHQLLQRHAAVGHGGVHVQVLPAQQRVSRGAFRHHPPRAAADADRDW
jgi:hypothetical protein